MRDKKKVVHPYIPNSVPEVEANMLKEIGVKDIDALYEDIPDNLRFKDEMNLPKPLSNLSRESQLFRRRMLAALRTGDMR
jgi:glycine cleavage system pyridoxal-binding protein P